MKKVKTKEHINKLRNLKYKCVGESESESLSVVSELCDPMDYTVDEILQAKILE